MARLNFKHAHDEVASEAAETVRMTVLTAVYLVVAAGVIVAAAAATSLFANTIAAVASMVAVLAVGVFALGKIAEAIYRREQ
jgi:positive regulator of sigma E activity